MRKKTPDLCEVSEEASMARAGRLPGRISEETRRGRAARTGQQGNLCVSGLSAAVWTTQLREATDPV